MKKIVLILVVAIFGFSAMAQHQCGSAAAKSSDAPILEVKGAETVIIQTNAYSAKSNELFEKTLPFVKGVKDFKYNDKNYKVAVAYDPKKTTPDAIRNAIAKMGFNADDVKANEQAREKLPAECKTIPKGCSKPCGKH
ncbi:MAG: heavy-metal-associated domain-containing protein [Bacteroidales bacterium]|jgi:copper chaperone CopZ|nr:heavy-metal-associated domain-containing protein [Bacteroidales bacterium]